MPNPYSVKEIITPAEIWALPNVSIDSKMSALMDLSYRHFCTGGIAKYYQTLNEIERFLYQSLRPHKAINIGMLNSPSHYGLACFIYADICRSVSLGYPTAFPYVFQPQSTHILTGTEVSPLCGAILSIADWAVVSEWQLRYHPHLDGGHLQLEVSVRKRSIGTSSGWEPISASSKPGGSNFTKYQGIQALQLSCPGRQ